MDIYPSAVCMTPTHFFTITTCLDGSSVSKCILSPDVDPTTVRILAVCIGRDDRVPELWCYGNTLAEIYEFRSLTSSP